ncbi:Replication factor C (RF-C) subunit [Tyrophagus putrescentiae]|nr:Replication factor C (RF-C) subunit [Tyrophagus putrescentiae]
MVQTDGGSNNSGGIHWIEKYRPKTLDDLVSHKDIITTIEKFINEDRMPHLLLYGPPGTGKTSTILACARKIFNEKEMPSMVLELNASDDRGIGIVRGPIQAFASTKVLFTRKAYKLIILDEADAMTHDAQNALRRIIEKYTMNVRFCFICNYINKIIPAIQSRCTKFRFAPLKSTQIESRLDYIISTEAVNATQDGKQALMELAEGDMRKVLNVLQSVSSAFSVVNEENVYRCCGVPRKADVEAILGWLLAERFTSTYQHILALQHEKGYALQDIITRIQAQIFAIEFPKDVKVAILEKLADIEMQLSGGGSEKVQMAALVGAFQCARDVQ